MIARTWTGTVHRADADEYAEHSRATGFAEYGQTPGDSARVVRRRQLLLTPM
jgi:hypothetical protein